MHSPAGCIGPFGFAQGRLSAAKYAAQDDNARETTTPGAEARSILSRLRGPEGPLFHGCSIIGVPHRCSSYEAESQLRRSRKVGGS